MSTAPDSTIQFQKAVLDEFTTLRGDRTDLRISKDVKIALSNILLCFLRNLCHAASNAESAPKTLTLQAAEKAVKDESVSGKLALQLHERGDLATKTFTASQAGDRQRLEVRAGVVVPVAKVKRVLKECLPEGTRVAQNAAVYAAGSSNEIINLVLREALEQLHRNKKKTISVATAQSAIDANDSLKAFISLC